MYKQTLQKTLEQLGWNRGHSIYTIYTTRGGGEQKGPDVEKSQKGQVCNNGQGYKYYSASPGLLYGGHCGCPGKKEPILYCRGFGESIYPLNEEEETFGCPGCNKPSKLKEFILYKCKATILFRKKGGIKQTVKYEVKDKDYIRFGKDAAGISADATYALLKFTVSR